MARGRGAALSLLFLVAGLAGCDRGATAGAGPGGDGTERHACYGNGTCNDGLVCLSKLCVRPPGADCDAVGEALVSLELGNYAPKDERKARVADVAAMCRAEHVTKGEGECLLEKQTKEDLAACPKPLIVKPMSDAARKALTTDGLPGACTEYVRLLERYARCPAVPADARRAITQSIDQMKQQWKAAATGPSAGAIAAACKQGLDGMRPAMASMGCP